MPQTVLASASFAAGLQTTFVNTWRRTTASLNPRLSKIMRLGIPSDKIEETFFRFEMGGGARRRIKGEPRPSTPFKGESWTVQNHNWSAGIHWYAQDRDDDQSRSMESQAAAEGESLGYIAYQVAMQIITGTVDASLLPAIPNAPDGLGIWAASRFGISGGTILTGAGVATAQDIRGDFFAGRAQILTYQGQDGRSLYPGVEMRNFVILYDIRNDLVFREAFRQSLSGGVTGSATTGGVSNVINESGVTVDLWPTDLITDDSWYMFSTDTDYRTLAETDRGGLQTIRQLKGQSDEANRLDIEGIYWEKRSGYTVADPINAIKVSN